MADFSFSAQFLQELAEWEATASSKEQDILDQALAAIIANPGMISINPGNDRRVGEEIAGTKSFCRVFWRL